MFDNQTDPHGNASIAASGAVLDSASQVILLVHGRGATAQSMFSLGQLFADINTTLIAPQASGNTWYPYSFMADESMNQPFLDSAINVLDNIVKRLKSQGFSENQIILVGFSQGACLSLEFAARSGYAFKLVAGLSGGLIGEQLQTSRYQQNLSTQNIFLGCSDVDFHIPVERVHETEKVFIERGAHVKKVIYPNMGHHVNDDEIEIIKTLLSN
ncbi:phospholipase [bacterium]|nr:MAG: phospholipase [bacterium]